MLEPGTLKFLAALKKNNNKVWFDKNRPAYEAARADFIQFIQAAIDLHGKKDQAIKNISARDCLFRINRDIRFSKDKSLYKTNFGASINAGGRKSFNTAGYYFHLEPGESFAGGGMYMPQPVDLNKIRQEIDYNYPAFKKITGSKKFKSVYGDLDRSEEFILSRVPKGYDPANPAAEYLRLKSYIGTVRITDSELVHKDLIKKTAGIFEALHPLINFLNNAIAG